MEYPIKSEYFVAVECWDCGHPDHNHRTEKAALSCIKRGTNKQASARRWTREDQYNVCVMALDGKTYKEVGKEYGISGIRIAQILCKSIRSCRNPIYDTTNDKSSEHMPWRDIESKVEIIKLRAHSGVVKDRLYRWMKDKG